MDTRGKIGALRRLMRDRNVAALIVPSADPHQSEYVASRWQARKWVSGFSGSAGTLVITRNQAGLWTDGRYFIQAERELKGSGITLFKSKEPGVPTVNEWILARLKPGQTVAFDGSVYSLEAVRDMRKAFETGKIGLRYSEDLVGKLWRYRPDYPGHPAYDFPVRYAGLGRGQKLAIVRKQLARRRADTLLLASLDDIAWLFNIRGKDVSNSPVVLAYAVIERRKAYLFANAAKFSRSLLSKLRKAGVVVCPYGAIRAHLKALPPRTSLCLNPRRVNQWVADAIPKGVRRVEETIDITTDLKAVKNPVEQGHFRKAALLDGVALVRFFAWLDRALAAGERITEYGAGVKLASLRCESPECRDDSFNAICATRGNAAMMHYSAAPEGSAVLGRRGLFLVDSGGNYFEGTMDTTRTVALGPVSRTVCRDYTLVLKGLIAFSQVRFLAGTTGTHLDAIARAPLWAEGLNYKCGSGHGVGSFLNVHEGPQGITPGWNPSPLKPGMVVTIEPGVYVQGSHGIRTENMVLVTPDRTTEHGEFLKFETLTVCPIDTAPLDPSLLSAEEREWLNAYHRRVCKLLSPRLSAPDRAWLKRKTAAV